jgi:hypothetical protein
MPLAFFLLPADRLFARRQVGGRPAYLGAGRLELQPSKFRVGDARSCVLGGASDACLSVYSLRIDRRREYHMRIDSERWSLTARAIRAMSRLPRGICETHDVE